MSRLSMLSVLALAACFGSCAPELPTAPNLQPVLDAYASPTAQVDGAVMAEWADAIEQAFDEIQDSEVIRQILDVIDEIQQELENSIAMTCQGGSMNGRTCNVDEDCEGGTCTGPSALVLGGVCSGGSNDPDPPNCASDGDCPDGTTCTGGVTLPSPTGAFQINYICPGWDTGQFDEGYDAQPDSSNGSVDLFMTLDGRGIGRVVWGTATQCRYLLPNEGDDCQAAGCSQALFDGSVAVDLGPDWVSANLDQLAVITFVVDGTIELEDDDLPISIKQSFRLVLNDESELSLVILVDIADPALSQTFNYIFAANSQGIRAANGAFLCSLEQSRCFDENGTTLFSW